MTRCVQSSSSSTLFFPVAFFASFQPNLAPPPSFESGNRPPFSTALEPSHTLSPAGPQACMALDAVNNNSPL